MKNNKGFTLVELLVCLALVSAVTTTVTIGVRSLLSKQQEKQHERYLKEVEDAACAYANINNLRNGCTNCTKTVYRSTLVNAGLLDADAKSPINGYKYSDTIKITWDSNGKKVCEYVEGIQIVK